MEIIPAIDLIEGKCVRLEQGSFGSKKSYHEAPLEVAQKFEDAGLRRLHLVDLDGARAKRVVNYRILERIATRTSLTIDVGGGIYSDEDLRIAFECGASMVTGGTVAVKQRELFLTWLAKYGAEKILLGADCRDGVIRVSGWEEETTFEVAEFLSEYQERGVKTAICTDIARDGLLGGPSLELYRLLRERLPDLRLVASGGITVVSDLELLTELGMSGAIIGKAIYEGRIRLSDLSRFIVPAGGVPC
jgi:phosphoribosylformimino-5-aminoimidazole carboxamide ribotide isomerase